MDNSSSRICASSVRETIFDWSTLFSSSKVATRALRVAISLSEVDIELRGLSSSVRDVENKSPRAGLVSGLDSVFEGSMGMDKRGGDFAKADSTGLRTSLFVDLRRA